MTTVKAMQLWARNAYRVASKAFDKAPSAQNWSALMSAALAHQQARQLSRPGVDAVTLQARQEQFDLLDDHGKAESIVRTTCGRSIGAVLADLGA